VPERGPARSGADAIEHRQYVERCLSADTDGEPDTTELRAARAHIEGCSECKETLAVTRKMKAETLTLGAVRAPRELRERILDALDEVDRESESRERRRVVAWISVGTIAACLVAILFMQMRPASNPTFDAAIATFDKMEPNFTPNVPSNSPDQLAAAFIYQFGVPMAWDFSSLGLSAVGGRFEHDVEGAPVGYSLYKGDRGALLCIVYRDEAFNFPRGGELVKGIHLYHYKGYSIAATRRYAVFAILVTKLPTADLSQVFAQLPG
jgi:anti-sigma factor RsiW